MQLLLLIKKKIAPPKLVMNFAIGVTKSDIKNVDIILYPIISPCIISLLKTSSVNAKNPTKQINNTTHFKFFLDIFFPIIFQFFHLLLFFLFSINASM